MIEALNDFMAAVFEPVFVLALLGVLRIGWHWRRKRPIPPGIAWMAFFLMFMLLWRIPMRIQSSRYSCAAMIPCAILAAWVLADLFLFPAFFHSVKILKNRFPSSSATAEKNDTES